MSNKNEYQFIERMLDYSLTLILIVKLDHSQVFYYLPIFFCLKLLIFYKWVNHYTKHFEL